MAVAAWLPIPRPCKFIPGKHQAKNLHKPKQVLARLLALACQRLSARPQASGKSITNALNCISVHHRNIGIGWQAQVMNYHTFKVLFPWPCPQAKEELT